MLEFKYLSFDKVREKMFLKIGMVNVILIIVRLFGSKLL